MIQSRQGMHDNHLSYTRLCPFRQQKTFQSRPDTYNGADRDLYSWTQTIQDIDVRVQVISFSSSLRSRCCLLQIPKHIKRGKEVKVNIAKQHIKVELIESNTWKTIIDDDLPWPIRAEESTWSLVPGEHVHVGHLTRSDEGVHSRNIPL